MEMVSRRYLLSGAAALATAGTATALAGTTSLLRLDQTPGPAIPAQGSGAAKRIPLRDFFRNAEKTNFKISPDGMHISFMQPHERRMNVFVQARAGGPAVRVTNETERSVASYFWKGPNRIVFTKDFKGDENFHIVSVDADGKNLVDLTPFDNVRASIISGRIDHDDEMIIGLNKRNPEVFDVYRLDLKTRELTLIAENPGNIAGWLADHDGRIRVAVSTDGANRSLLYRADDKSPFMTVITTNFRESIGPLFFSFDNKRLYAASNINRDKAAIVLIDPATATEERVIFEHPDVDVSSLDWSHKRKVLTEVQFMTWKRQRVFLDAEMEAIHRDLEKQLPGYEIDVQSHDKGESVFVVAAWSDRTQGVRYLYEAATRLLTKLAEIAPWLDEKELVETKPISYRSRDGLTIHGYLTLPRGAGKNLPLIVNPHGGPSSRDVWGYDPEAQFLANRGYAVLHVNFRGSTGYGRKFWEAGFKQWGKKMQDDISDGVHYAVREGIADPKRVGIYGISYGGYATLAGLAFTPELYACGVDFVGPSNLFTLLKTVPPYWKPMLEMMYEQIGHPEKDKALLEAASPALHADKMRAPLMIAQGAKDPRVNVEESNQMVAALKQRGVEVEYMLKENEGHGFANEENRFEFYEAMERFLAKHLRGGAA
jgi:dipeptidyl aminopeptidase/acylaminoacyl peptidase